ncbi:N-alpha-acetyltransferase 50 [Halotydeus destructor]|nr:N-alpha-acetyltransferase 50 [Halotydeus destructor]
MALSSVSPVREVFKGTSDEERTGQIRKIPKVVGRIELGDVTPHNIKILKRLNQVVFPVSYNDKFYKDVLEAGELAKLAYYNDIVVGAVCCRVDSSENMKRLYIMTLGCLAPYRGLGIGTIMLEHVLRIANNDKFDGIFLHVQISNETAINFYKKFDFEIIETKEHYYKRIEPADAHVLQKTLRKKPAQANPSTAGGAKIFRLFLFFLGFGLSVSYYTSYTFSGVGYNLLATSLSVQWFIVLRALLNGSERIELDISSLEDAEWSCLAMVIALVAVHGKISSLQIVALALVQPVFYVSNKHILQRLQVTDMAGGFRICVFGSFFGFGLSLMLWRYNTDTRQKRLYSSTMNQFFVLLSTLWLFCLWPICSSARVVGDKKHRIFLNNYLAMMAALIASFAASSLMDPHNRFSIRIIQIGTTGGAMAISCLSEMMVQPHGALMIGVLGAFISISSRLKLAPSLARTLRVQDIFHANCAFGLTSFTSGLLNVVYTLYADVGHYGSSLYEIFPARAPRANTTDLEEIILFTDRIKAGVNRTELYQAGYQGLALIASVISGIVGGLVAGLVMKLPLFDSRSEENMYNDADSWLIPTNEDMTIIGNESNCDIECSQNEESAPMKTLQIPKTKQSTSI